MDRNNAGNKELERILEGTPDIIIECIMNFIEKLNSKGYAYKCAPRIGGAPDSSKRDSTHSIRCSIFETNVSGDKQVGTIKLLLLPQERTLFKFPKLTEDDSSFSKFLTHLLSEFDKLGFIYLGE